jgi:hypothetical protein
MTPSYLTFLVAYLLADFVYPGNPVSGGVGKSAGRAGFKYALVHYLTAVLLAGLLQGRGLVSWRFQTAALALTALHPLLHRLERSLRSRESAGTLVLDQLAHVGMVGVVVRLTLPAAAEWGAWLVRLRAHGEQTLSAIVVYTVVMFGGGTFIRFVMRPLLWRLGEVPEQLENAGLYIGWLERFLVVTALVLQSPSTVGLILTAKSVVRFPELKSFRFAEYFLVGTLLSLCFAVIGGLILARALR